MSTIHLISFAILISFQLCSKDYYSILKIAKNASDDQIKTSYKKLVRTFHPDKNKHREKWAKNQFILVQEAYEVLSDPKKKNIYDEYGEEGIRQFEQNEAQNEQPTGGPFDQFAGGTVNVEEILGSLFEGGFIPGGFTADGSSFKMGGAGEGFKNMRKEKKNPLKDPNFIRILSEDMLPDFTNLKYSFGLFIYHPKYIGSDKYNHGISRQSSIEKIEEVVEKYGAYLNIGLLNCSEQPLICENVLQKTTKNKTLSGPIYIVFGASNQHVKLDLTLRHMSTNKIIGTHVQLNAEIVTRLTAENFADFVTENVNRKVIISITNKKVTSLLLLSLANTFINEFVVGEIHVSEEDLLRELKIDSGIAPQIMVMKNLITFERDLFQGAFKKDPLTVFFNQKYSELNEKEN